MKQILFKIRILMFPHNSIEMSYPEKHLFASFSICNSEVGVLLVKAR